MTTDRNINPETGLGWNNKRGYRRGTWEYNRNHGLLRAYKITLQEWYDLFDKQGNVCAICLGDHRNGKNWHTDHNHKTGTVRGILCGSCNTGIGKLKENKQIMLRAIDYIERTRD